MANPSTCPPLTPEAIRTAHALISPYIHHTPVLTSKTINRIASTPQAEATCPTDQPPAHPVFRLYFKCGNLQKIGAFKARGAFHALLRLCSEMGEEEVRRRGVTTHSSGNHAQALALAASTLDIPAHIVMPSISTASKIAGTRGYGARVPFSGSTEPERVAVVNEVIQETGAILVPPYDHPDIILGQATAGLELEAQVVALFKDRDGIAKDHPLDAVITPLGGGGLLAGTAIHFSTTPSTHVFGAEPSFQGGDDGRRGLAAGSRIEAKRNVRGVFPVTEDQIKEAMRLVLERMKLFIEPSAAVPLAVVLFDKEFRRIAEKKGGEKEWDVGIILSGGNTTVEAICKLYGEQQE